jgi:hypothetical protein
LSFDALGQKLAEMYQDLIERNSSAAVSRTVPTAHRAVRGV